MEIRKADPIVIEAENNFTKLDSYIRERKAESILLVCGKSIDFLKIGDYFKKFEQNETIKLTRFSEFSPNPSYESVVEGVKRFHTRKCDTVIGVGGGSAMDVAKCIKLFATMNPNENYLKQKIEPNNIKLFAIPTTAGTGSESTQFAVIYENGEKKSVSDKSSIPELVYLDASNLETLPLYQRKVTMMDAFCHALESYWSVRSTAESKGYAKEAIQLILRNYQGYLKNQKEENKQMMRAANLAGKAINIAQTTAGHAMCYKLTTLYGIAHGHAAALCVNQLWEYMICHTEHCVDGRGQAYLKSMFLELANLMGCEGIEQAVWLYRHILNSLELPIPTKKKPQDFTVLCTSVNLERLKNNPIELSAKTIDFFYHQILS